MQVWSSSFSMVMVWPAGTVVPQRKPGDRGICASSWIRRASQMSRSKVPLKLPRRYIKLPGHAQLLGEPRQVQRWRRSWMKAAIPLWDSSRLENIGNRWYP